MLSSNVKISDLTLLNHVSRSFGIPLKYSYLYIQAVGVMSIKLFAVEDIIAGLKKLFENIMKHGYKLEDKCLRNEILILLNYLMRDEKALQYFAEKPN